MSSLPWSSGAVAAVAISLVGCGGTTKTVAALAPGASATGGSAAAGGGIETIRNASELMAPTYRQGQLLKVNVDAYLSASPERGDVIIFRPPAGADSGVCGVQQPVGEPCPTPTPMRSSSLFIKRVDAVGEDQIKILNNRTYLDGKLQPEPFIEPGTPCADLCNMPRSITITQGAVFTMGDNRGQSADSREWGPIPRKWIVGKVVGTQ